MGVVELPEPFHGTWAFGDEPECEFYGAATFTPDEGWRLQATGGRIPVDSAADVPVGGDYRKRNLVGRCGHVSVALLDAYAVITSPGTYPHQHITDAEIHSSTGLVGATAPDGWKFDRITIGSEPLRAWAWQGLLGHHDPVGPRPRTIELEWPDDQAVEVPCGRLKLRFLQDIDLAHGTVTARATPLWVFEPLHRATIRELDDLAARPLDYLHVVCTGDNLGDWTTKLYQGEHEWTALRSRTRRPAMPTHSWNWAYSASQLVPLQRYLNTWFEFYDHTADALHPLMSVLTNGDAVHLETRILLLAHGLEAYHRTHPGFSQKAVEPEDFKRRKDLIKQSVDSESWRWLSAHIAHADDPSFRVRVQDIVNHAGTLGLALAGNERFASSVRDVRDQVAHGVGRKHRSPDEWSKLMATVYFTTTAIMRVALLRDIGLDDGEVDVGGRRLKEVQFALQRLRG